MRLKVFSMLAFLLLGLATGASQAQLGPPAAFTTEQVMAPNKPVPADYFGMHLLRTVDQGSANFFVTPWPSISFQDWRLWDSQVTWRQLEPQKGMWRFRMLDQYVALAEQNHVQILMTLGQTPTWASARPTEKTYFRGTAAEPTSLDDWDDYVRTVATRYKGKIHAYEIWNEPNLPMFYSGTIPILAEMSQRAAAILKQVDPSIIVVSPGITFDPTYLDRYIKAGGAKGIDVIAFHFYVHGQPEDVVAKATAVKQVLADNGLSSLPLWDTESGWGDWKDGVHSFTPDSAAGFIARSEILIWAAGISRLYWYSWDNTPWIKLTLTQPDNATETQAAQAYRSVHNWMLDSRFHDCRNSSDDLWTCTLTRAGHPAWIVWAPQGDRSYTPPGSWHVGTEVTLSGTPTHLTSKTVTVGASPVLLY